MARAWASGGSPPAAGRTSLSAAATPQWLRAGILTVRVVHIGRQSSCCSEAERRFNEDVVAASLDCVAVAVAHAKDLNGPVGNDDGSRAIIRFRDGPRTTVDRLP
jgi:hypothetical protein